MFCDASGGGLGGRDSFLGGMTEMSAAVPRATCYDGGRIVREKEDGGVKEVRWRSYFKVARDPFKKKEALHSTRIRAFGQRTAPTSYPCSSVFDVCVALSGKITKEGDRQRVECAVLCQGRL